MANLLPEQHIERNKRERQLRLLAVSCGAAGLVLLAASVALLPSLVYSTIRAKDVMAERGVIETSLLRHEGTMTKTVLDLFGDQLTLLKEQESEPLIRTYLETVIAARTAGIQIDEFVYAKEGQEVRLVGAATTRSELVAFVEVLKESEHILDVVLPVENLAQSTDIVFSLRFIGTL